MVAVYFEAAAVITALVLLGQILKLRARSRTNAVIKMLVGLAPKTARIVRKDGSEEDIPLEHVQPGDTLRVRPGGKVPVDGTAIKNNVFMKIGNYKAATLTLLLICVCAAVMSGCPSDQGTSGSSGGVVAVPHGYMARLEQVHDGRIIGFGPFVGYYFRPEDPEDLSRLRFVCFNENRFYSSDMPDGAKLYEGTALRATLPRADVATPTHKRIHPVFFQEAPETWRNTRPEPRDEFVHFHSGYDAVGPVLTGYWIRHVAISEFTYDMGGRVGKESPLYHRVRKGPDREFARIIEFDRGPGKDN